MADDLTVDIVTPDGRAFQGTANGVRAPGVEGSFEVRTDHAPMISAFGIGPLIVKAQSTHEYEIVENTVTVLAETVEPASEIDVDRAESAQERARRRLEEGDLEERETHEAALERARNRLRVAMGQVGQEPS
ncbi:MAG: ATP synthase F1 subunit epsilon [Bacteroidetes bacterium QH_10_64_19]|nr:MAG: ATP synthase F1 subunit epsilon [Bacteroidetes bacterium QH_10_64_19]